MNVSGNQVSDIQIPTGFAPHWICTTLDLQQNVIIFRRYVKYIHEMIWVSFMDNSKAIDAVDLSPITVCGHEMTIRLKSPDWRKILDDELKLCSDQVS